MTWRRRLSRQATPPPNILDLLSALEGTIAAIVVENGHRKPSVHSRNTPQPDAFAETMIGLREMTRGLGTTPEWGGDDGITVVTSRSAMLMRELQSPRGRLLVLWGVDSATINLATAQRTLSELLSRDRSGVKPWLPV